MWRFSVIMQILPREVISPESVSMNLVKKKKKKNTLFFFWTETQLIHPITSPPKSTEMNFDLLWRFEA